MTNNPLLANPRPWCIGRFVMNRPARSELNSERYAYWGDKIDIKSDVSVQAFQHRVELRETELRAKTRTGSISYKEMQAKGLKSLIVKTDIPWLERVISPTQTSRVFFYSDDVDHPDLLLNEEGYVLAGTTMLTMKSLLRPGDVQKSIERTSDVYRNITYRDDWTVPSGPGFCVKGALIGGPSRNSEESQQTIVLQPGKASAFVLSMRVAVDGDQRATLLGTLPDLRRELQTQGYGNTVTVLRESKRQVAGMDAEEVLFSVTENGIQLFRFFLLAPGVPKAVARPYVDIQLILGSTNDSTLTPEQASSPVDEKGYRDMGLAA
ncbi:T6SS immunity protein Tli4 family protein [Burkholderia sp. Leaf177]|uniref:T6SS immunity protein Tli4 family protein n=1 Tax=Burkholderia sp. Leaf177 TaxID=1736287 RepID=UPI0006FF4332|nr:T6SS immunity protein Tli4 family protein [Burkholderia sp. Leaf177]